MSLDAPAFQLPACPICSNAVGPLVRPLWKSARNSTRARGVACWALVGCEHAAEVSPPGRIHDDLEVIELVESAWTERIAQLFAARTASWPPVAVAALRRALDSVASVPGVPMRLPFPPASPAQPTNETKK